MGRAQLRAIMSTRDGKSPTQSNDSPAKTPPKIKVIGRDFSVQAMPSESTVVSKALSSSDTELLFLNGSDPVAEAAIRQLRESSKQSFKSPRKKSTIIISGISKTAVSQDEEASLMFNYAEAMDNSVMNSPHSVYESATPTSAADIDQLEVSVPTLPSPVSEDGLLGTWEQGSELEEWNINGLEDPDCEGVSISNLSVSETGSMKKSKGGFLKKGAKLFFRRRHQQKEPGMSQSQNDLVYLETPRSGEHPKKGATLSRLLHRKRLKNKDKSPTPGTPTGN
uniref:C2 calcium-dependent domain containing 2 n=1 Tax=Xenopus tropicalis TaxID=8364 RepID=A0A6I8R7J5_XENTR